MNEQQKLTLKMAILFLIVFVFFGVIIVKEKFEIIFTPKVEKIFDTYLENNYTSIYSTLKKNKINYKNDTFTLKITSSKNKNLFFYLKYSNKKIKDTYKKDYIEGSSLLKHITKSVENNIFIKTNEHVTVRINRKLNDFTKNAQEKILTEKNYSSLKIYSIEKEFLLDNFSEEIITKNILTFTNSLKELNITPKSYDFIITDSKLSKTISIKNLTETTLTNDYLPLIIKDILNNNNSDLIKNNNITFTNEN